MTAQPRKLTVIFQPDVSGLAAFAAPLRFHYIITKFSVKHDKYASSEKGGTT